MVVMNLWWNVHVFNVGLYKQFDTLRPRQNEHHFPDDIFKWIFLNENVQIWLKISLKFVPRFRINNIPPLVQIMTWRRLGDKPLSEPMMVSLPTHICVTRPQWANSKGSFVPAFVIVPRREVFCVCLSKFECPLAGLRNVINHFQQQY